MYEARFTLLSNVKDLPGIGKTRLTQLNKLGIFTVKDLIYYFPRAYENRKDVKQLGSFTLDTPASYILTVATEVKSSRVKKGMTVSKFRAFDESGSVEVIFFNMPYVKDVFRIGTSFRFYGKASFGRDRRLVLTNPKYEAIVEGKPLEDFLPIYSLTGGLTSKLLEKIIKSAINDCLPSIEDHLPDDIRIQNELPSLTFALKNIHFPESPEALVKAKRRLAFDEMLSFALGISISLSGRSMCEGVQFSPCSIKPILDLLPYELTNSQKQAINDIYRDTVIKRTDGKTPAMARILIGDVGSGKTVCAAIAMYIAAMSDYQSALLVPTEILAYQHYNELTELFSKLGKNVALLTGSVTASQKKKIYEKLKSGEIDIIVGTHALISDKVEFKNLGLIITDEQHRFGVGQRAVLKNKEAKAHMLVMSATPIPRTLALALYGDLDISRITELPKGRQRVDTFVVNESYRQRIYSFIEKQVKLGGQCYIVCPSIENNEDEAYGYNTEGITYANLIEEKQYNLKNAVEYCEELKKVFPSFRIECLHGRIKSNEKDEIMQRFASGETQILVSTTVIEVGVNVPNASLMIVENAERFGLSQLHQLRGRVGRGSRKSYCLLVSDINNEKSKARLEVMRTTYDGYEIADKDLMLRGPGDFFSSISSDNLRQSGGFDFKIASSCDDTSLFELAFSTAKGIINSDPNLELPVNSKLKEYVKDMITPASTIS